MEDYNPNIEMYAEKICNALEWFKHARSLLAAARSTKERASVLVDHWEKSDLGNVASMLYGFSLENLFKAQWILKKFGPPDTKNWHPIAEFPKELKTHNLLQLAELIDPNLAKEYGNKLEILSDCTVWSGRYPCSIKVGESGWIRWPALHEDAEEIFKRYSREFTALN